MPSSTSILYSVLVIPLAALIALYTDAFNSLELVGSLISQVRLFQHSSIVPEVFDALCNTTYVGTAHDGVEQYLNIFYAQDASGSNRFAPPKSLLCVPGARIDATKSGAWCPQGTGESPLPFTSPITNISENCLSLGITRPDGVAAGAKLPVIVYMHGGGHALGSYADQLYAPAGLVNQSVSDGRPVVLVGINYRLGMFGFARSNALTEAGHTNAGLRDQRAAFEWIRAHIASFGGDPDNVISMGQSVGASDTGLHMTSYGGEKGVPFHKAVMMSGAPGLTFNIESDLVQNNTATVAETLGCAIDGNTQSQASLECLQTVPMESLMNISVTNSRLARPPFGEGFFYPTRDNDYIPYRPSKLLREGRFVKNIPVMASWCTNDGAWYAPPTTQTDEEVLASFGLWLFNLSPSTQQKLLDLYPVDDFQWMAESKKIGGVSPQYYRAAQTNRDLWFTCPVLDFTYQHARHAPNTTRVPTYIYENNATRFTPIFENIMHVPFWGVSHLSDVPYMLNDDVAAGGDNSAPAKDLAREMGRALVRFAYSGHPGSEWPMAYGSSSGNGRTWETESSPGEISMMLWRQDEQEANGGSGSGPVTVRRKTSTGEASDEKSKAVEWEKLFERCDFINSREVRDQIGV